MTNGYGGRDEGDRARGAAELGIGGFGPGSAQDYGDGARDALLGTGDRYGHYGGRAGNANTPDPSYSGDWRNGGFMGDGQFQLVELIPGVTRGYGYANGQIGPATVFNPGELFGGLLGGFLAGAGGGIVGGNMGGQLSNSYVIDGPNAGQWAGGGGGLLGGLLSGGGTPGGLAGGVGNDYAHDELSKLTGGLTPSPAPQPQAQSTPRIFDPLRGIWYTV